MLPVRVKVEAESPAVLLEGEILFKVGAKLLTVRFIVVVTPPPGGGLTTLIGNIPPAATSAAETCVVTRVELTSVVGRSTPLN